MSCKVLMVQGTSSGAGKSTIVTALCRILSNKGYKIAPFKSQNMSSFIHQIENTNKIIAKAQAIQAVASRKNPNARMNPILLKPIGNNQSKVFVNGDFFKVMDAQQYYSDFVLNKGFAAALEAFNSLKQENDVIIIEGAGSPAEINIQKYDIANMLFANKVKSPVILVSDIERGGCFASILGTILLLKPNYRKLIRGIVINKFSGDHKILEPATDILKLKVKKPILGIIPKIEHNIPDEDSLDNNKSNLKEVKEKSNYLQNLDKEIDKVAKTIQNSIDIEFVLDSIIKNHRKI